MEDRIRISQINNHIWLMDDAGESTGYLVVGSEKAAVIDTMNGYANVREAVRAFTRLPLVVINTHGHCDHIFGNVFFDAPCLMHPADLPIAENHMLLPDFVKNCEENGLRMPPFAPVADGDVIDLGGIHLQVISLPEHTPGSICLLDREDRILFTGDAINHHLWMQLPHSLSIEELIENLDKMMWVKDKADLILHGHAKAPVSIRFIDELRSGAQHLLDTEGQGDPVYRWFGGEDHQHPFGKSGSVICYRKDHLRKR